MRKTSKPKPRQINPAVTKRHVLHDTVGPLQTRRTRPHHLRPKQRTPLPHDPRQSQVARGRALIAARLTDSKRQSRHTPFCHAPDDKSVPTNRHCSISNPAARTPAQPSRPTSNRHQSTSDSNTRSPTGSNLFGRSGTAIRPIPRATTNPFSHDTTRRPHPKHLPRHSPHRPHRDHRHLPSHRNKLNVKLLFLDQWPTGGMAKNPRHGTPASNPTDHADSAASPQHPAFIPLAPKPRHHHRPAHHAPSNERHQR